MLFRSVPLLPSMLYVDGCQPRLAGLKSGASAAPAEEPGTDRVSSLSPRLCRRRAMGADPHPHSARSRCAEVSGRLCQAPERAGRGTLDRAAGRLRDRRAPIQSIRMRSGIGRMNAAKRSGFSLVGKCPASSMTHASAPGIRATRERPKIRRDQALRPSGLVRLRIVTSRIGAGC